MVAIGYPPRRMREMAGGGDLNDALLRILKKPPGARVQVSTAYLMRDLYRKYSGLDAEDYGIALKVATRMRRYAQKRGWGPPASWDDPGTLGWSRKESFMPDTRADYSVDDVVVDRLVAGKSVGSYTHGERLEAVRRMLARGMSPGDVLVALHLSSGAYYRLVEEL
jgi:hypothetical protein